MALQNTIQQDQENKRDLQSRRCAKNDEIFNSSPAFFATSGQMGHFRSKQCTYSKSPDFWLKIMPAEKSNFTFYKNSVWGA